MATAVQTSSDTIDAKQLLRTLMAVKKGDFSARMPVDQTGSAGEIVDTLNEIIELNEKMLNEFERISTVVGKEGKITQRATISGADGTWLESVNPVNTLITDLVQPTSETACVIRAVARGDLSQTIALEIEGRPLKGEFLQTAKIVNTMVDQLNSFASAVTRVVREVGTEGKLGGQAQEIEAMNAELQCQLREVQRLNLKMESANHQLQERCWRYRIWTRRHASGRVILMRIPSECWSLRKICNRLQKSLLIWKWEVLMYNHWHTRKLPHHKLRKSRLTRSCSMYRRTMNTLVGLFWTNCKVIH